MEQLELELMTNKQLLKKTAEILYNSKNLDNKKIAETLVKNLKHNELQTIVKLNNMLQNLDNQKFVKAQEFINTTFNSNNFQLSPLIREDLTSMLFSCFFDLQNLAKELKNVFENLPNAIVAFAEINELRKQQNEINTNLYKNLEKGLKMENIKEIIKDVVEDFETDVDLNDKKNLLNFLLSIRATDDERLAKINEKDLAKYFIEEVGLEADEVKEVLAYNFTYEYSYANLDIQEEYREDFYSQKRDVNYYANGRADVEVKELLENKLKEYAKLVDEIAPKEQEHEFNEIGR